MRDRTSNCPKLYFVDDDAPIYLQTDASNYGIGAYLFQRQAVAFFSKSLSKAQLRWYTYEKKAYAIFAAVQKWDYLLRDVKFEIQTDHEVH